MKLVNNWAKAFQTQGTASSKASKQKCTWSIPLTERMAKWLEQSARWRMLGGELRRVTGARSYKEM